VRGYPAELQVRLRSIIRVFLRITKLPFLNQNGYHKSDLAPQIGYKLYGSTRELY
jgi:hypothetical protein